MKPWERCTCAWSKGSPPTGDRPERHRLHTRSHSVPLRRRRDRTGVLAAILLLTLGASEDDIVADYARTGDNMPAIIERKRPVLGAMWKALGFDQDMHDTTALLSGSMDVSMRVLLARLGERHKDALAPLRFEGTSEGTIARLQQRALAA